MQDVAQEHDVVTVAEIVCERIPDSVTHDIVKALLMREPARMLDRFG